MKRDVPATVKIDLKPLGPHYTIAVFNLGPTLVDATVVISGEERGTETWAVSLRRNVILEGEVLEFDPPSAMYGFDVLRLSVAAAYIPAATDLILDLPGYMDQIAEAGWIAWDSPERHIVKGIGSAAAEITAAVSQVVEAVGRTSDSTFAINRLTDELQKPRNFSFVVSRAPWWKRLFGRG